jgi:hypothetical protein
MVDEKPALLRCDRQCVIADRFVRSRVVVGITGHGVIFAVDLACPFVVPGFAVEQRANVDALASGTLECRFLQES